MLNLNTIEAISPFVMHNSRRRFITIPGSMLSQLTQNLIEKQQVLASIKHDGAPHVEYDINDLANMVSVGSQDDVTATQCHQDVLDEATTTVMRVMRNNIKLTRGTILPLIDRYTDELTKVISEKCNRSVLALNIIEDTSVTILSSNQLKSIVAEQANWRRYDEITIPRVHEIELSLPELVQLLKTGQAKFDTLVSNWINVNGLEFRIKEIYSDLFLKSDGKTTDDLFLKYINIDSFDSALIALLLCWGLSQNLQDGINLSHSEYKTIMNIFSSGCCGIISQSISKYERAGKNKDLIIKYPANNRQFCYDDVSKNNIIVNGETYAKFLEMGGTPEMIFGSYLTTRATRASIILDNAKNNIKTYNQVINRGKLTSINNTLTIVQEELRRIAFDIVKSINDQTSNRDDQDYLIEFTGNDHMVKANEYIRTLNSRHLDDYYTTVRNFVCRCFFDGTMVLDLLDRIDTLAGKDESKDINELALVATIDLVVDWFISQIQYDTVGISTEGYYIK